MTQIDLNQITPGTKGDLIASDGSLRVTQSIGTDGYVLSADSAQTSGLNWIPVSNGSATIISVNQVAHGFTGGEVIRSSGVDDMYTLAQADTAADAEVVGIVTNVIDVDNFEFTSEGLITTNVPVATAGTVYFLSESVAGTLTSTEPTGTGEVSKPLVIILESGGRMLLLNWRGEVIASAGTDSNVKPLSVTLNVDLASLGTTLLYSVPSGKTAIVVDFIVVLTDVDTLTTDPHFSVGDNAASYDDWFGNFTVGFASFSSGINSSASLLGLKSSQGVNIETVFPSTSDVYLKVNTAATATSLKATVYTLGFLV